MKNTHRQVRFTHIIAIILLFIISGCMSYYRTNTVGTPPAYRIQSVIDERKIVILHYRNKIIGLKEPTLLNDSISGLPDLISGATARYLHPRDNKPNRYRKDHWAEVMSQVHIYINDDFPDSADRLVFARNNINRLDSYSYDKHASNSSKALGVLLIVGVVIATVAAGVQIFNVPISFF